MQAKPLSRAKKFRLNDPVWVLRLQPMGTHRTKTWFMPVELVCRIGEDTYSIKVGRRQLWERHESQLCARWPDICEKHVSLDYEAHEADSDDDYAEQDAYTVEKNLAQRPNAWGSGNQCTLAWLFAVSRHLGNRLFLCATDKHPPYGLCLQAQDSAAGLRLGSSYPGD